MREGLDVGGGEAELAATLGAADDDPLDAVRAAQDLARALHITLGDEPPGQGRGERLTAPGGTAHVQLHHLDVEVVRLALLAQEVDIAGRLVAETEVRALDDGLGVQLVDEDLGHEVGGRQLRELGGEGEDEQRVHTQIGAQLGAAVVRGEQRGVAAGADDLARVRVEGHHDGGNAQLTRAVHGMLDDQLVSACTPS